MALILHLTLGYSFLAAEGNSGWKYRALLAHGPATAGDHLCFVLAYLHKLVPYPGREELR